MDPAYLHALMHGEISFKKKNPDSDETGSKSKFELELEKELDAFVEGLKLDEDPDHPALQSPKFKRQKIKMELKEATKLPELFGPVNNGIDVIFSEGPNYLSEEEYHTLVLDLAMSITHLADIGIQETGQNDLQIIARISDTSIKALEKIAVAKFDEERYADSLGILCLLSILVPGYSEYWFRLGIAAQKTENYNLASKAYSITLDLYPDNIGARLFAAQCFIERSLIDDAKAEISMAKERLKSGGVDKVWLDFLQAIESTMTA